MPTFTQDQYTALNAAIAQGALRVKYADKEVEYRSLDEMLQLKRTMEADLGIAGSNPNPGRRYATFSKGTC